MTDWIRVTAIPNKDAQDSAPRAHFLLNAAAIASISVRPDERVQIAFDMDPYSNRPVIEVAESMAEIEAQLGLQPLTESPHNPGFNPLDESTWTFRRGVTRP